MASTGLKKGLDPDKPRNLSRVVVLADEDPPKDRNMRNLTSRLPGN